MESYIKKFPNESLARSDANHIRRQILEKGYIISSEEIEPIFVKEEKLFKLTIKYTSKSGR